MRPATIYIFVFHLLFFNSGLAQTSRDSLFSLENKVTTSDLVIEGHVLTTKGFKPRKGQIYTSALISITKIFKGNISDSTIEIIYLGGYADSTISMVSHSLSLTPGMEGIFFLKNNRTSIKLAQRLQSYELGLGRRSYIAYHEEKYMVAHHVATCVGETYDDLERDLFEQIEKITGIPRKVLGLNMFELKTGKPLKGNAY